MNFVNIFNRITIYDADYVPSVESDASIWELFTTTVYRPHTTVYHNLNLAVLRVGLIYL